jgi:hypothetical protein
VTGQRGQRRDAEVLGPRRSELARRVDERRDGGQPLGQQHRVRHRVQAGGPQGRTGQRG